MAHAYLNKKSRHGQALEAPILGHLLAKRDAEVEQYLKLHPAKNYKYRHYLVLVAQAYCIAGNHLKVEEYFNLHTHARNHIYIGYAFSKNYAKVDEYMDKLLRAHPRIESKFLMHQLAEAYAFNNNHAKVEECYQKGVLIHVILKGYIATKNDDKIGEFYNRDKEYSMKYNIAFHINQAQGLVKNKYYLYNLLDTHIRERKE